MFKHLKRLKKLNNKIPQFNTVVDKETHEKHVEKQREKIIGLKAKWDKERNWSEKMADKMTELFGTLTFFIINLIVFAIWILANNNVIPGIKSFDPYPFNFLTMTVSLEAIFLAIIVLMSQNRASRIDDLREEIDLRINVRAEEEITRIINILDAIHDHIGLPAEDDAELTEMKKKTNLNDIETEIENELKNED